jgi:hypothetical protein
VHVPLTSTVPCILAVTRHGILIPLCFPWHTHMTNEHLNAGCLREAYAAELELSCSIPSLYRRPKNLRSIVILIALLPRFTKTSNLTSVSRSIIRSRQANAFHLQPCRVVPAIRALNCSRSFSVGAPKATGLMPDTENPSTPKREPLATTLTPANITDEEFHTLSDAFLEKVHEKAEQVQEGREDVEVDYSVINRCPSQH